MLTVLEEGEDAMKKDLANCYRKMALLKVNEVALIRHNKSLLFYYNFTIVVKKVLKVLVLLN